MTLLQNNKFFISSIFFVFFNSAGGAFVSIKEFFDVDASQDDFVGAIANLTPKQKQLLMAFLKSL